MPSVRCQCGAIYNFKAEHAGRQARCRRCDAIVIAQPMPARLLTAPPAEAASTAGGSARARAVKPPATQRPVRERDGFVAFVADALSSFVVIARPMNLLACVGVAFVALLGSAPVPGIFGLVWGFAVTMIVLSYYMQVLQSSAGGDDALPLFEEWQGWVESGLRPFIRFICTGVVFLPLLAFESAIEFEAIDVAASERSVIRLALTGLGMYLWPAALLGVAILGAGFVVRWDLIVRTALAAPLRYLVALGVALLANLLTISADRALQPEWLAPVFDGLGLQGEHAMMRGLSRAIVLALISTYASLVAMRVIGLYYRRCRQRLPFDAG